MPELPEVETVVRTLAPYITGCKIMDARLLHQPSLHPDSLPLATLKGFVIRKALRRGKLIRLVLNNPLLPVKDRSLDLFFHLRMTGKLLLANSSADFGKHCRCFFTLEKKEGEEFRLLFEDVRTFGKIFAASEKELLKWNFWRRLGPEPLEMQSDDLLSRLKGDRPIKNALLDQEVIAGIGNIYADESLFRAGINPHRPASSLSSEESRKLLGNIQAILSEAIEKGGSSIRDYVDAHGNAGNFQNSFAVYGQGGKKCKICGATLEKSRIGGRATVFCPVCQK